LSVLNIQTSFAMTYKLTYWHSYWTKKKVIHALLWVKKLVLYSVSVSVSETISVLALYWVLSIVWRQLYSNNRSFHFLSGRVL